MKRGGGVRYLARKRQQQRLQQDTSKDCSKKSWSTSHSFKKFSKLGTTFSPGARKLILMNLVWGKAGVTGGGLVGSTGEPKVWF